MPDVSRLPEIIDASAAVAHRITGIESAFGVGTGDVVDLYTGLAVPAQPSNALSIGPGVHVSRWPRSWSIKWLSATVCEITWLIPMDVSLLGPDLPTLLSQAAALLTAYVAMFAQYSQLGGRCNSALITGGQPRQDPPTLELDLTVVERLNFELQPGGVI